MAELIFIFLVFGGGSVVHGLVTKYLDHKFRIKKLELESRRIEAIGQLEPSAQQVLLEEGMPDWMDKDDPEDVESWKAARREIQGRVKERS